MLCSGIIEISLCDQPAHGHGGSNIQCQLTLESIRLFLGGLMCSPVSIFNNELAALISLFLLIDNTGKNNGEEDKEAEMPLPY